MLSIIVECPECHHPIDSDLKDLGEYVTCPECTEVILVTPFDLIPADYSLIAHGSVSIQEVE